MGVQQAPQNKEQPSGVQQTEEVSRASESTTSVEEACKDALEALSAIQNKFQATVELLNKEKGRIKTLENHILSLSKEQSATRAPSCRECRSRQAQMGGRQHFISTADTHADQDIIRKLKELNQEVYQTSRTMADILAERLKSQRLSAIFRQTKERSVADFALESIGIAMVKQLAVVEGTEEIALFLQVAFQGYLSHMLCDIVSLWTVDQKLSASIEEVYQTLCKAETPAVSGRWRALTRKHILPTHASGSKPQVEIIIGGLHDIITAAGFVSTHDAMSPFWSKFSEKISPIVSDAWTIGDMASGMISGDFKAFAVKPGGTFDGESMVDTGGDQGELRKAGAARTVLCASEVGLKKQTREKTIVLIKAGVVLKSLLGPSKYTRV